jgi:hypothetical protein
MTAPTRHVCFFTLSTQSSRSATRLFVPTQPLASSSCTPFALRHPTHSSRWRIQEIDTPSFLLHAHTTNSKSVSPNMSRHNPYHVDKFRVGNDGIIIPIESSLRAYPTAEEEQAVSNSQPHILKHCSQQLTSKQAMDDMDRGLPPRYIYPEPAARGSYDAQGRLAGYYHSGEEVPQSAEQEQEQEFPAQGPRGDEHSYSHHDEHGRLFDRNGRCLDVDGQCSDRNTPMHSRRLHSMRPHNNSEAMRLPRTSHPPLIDHHLPSLKQERQRTRTSTILSSTSASMI